jgi:hypothetical protein
LDGISAADCVDAVIVSVEVTEFAPGVTDDGESAQVGLAIVGFTAPQLSWMGLSNEPPLRGAMVITSVTWPPSCAVKLADADCSEKSDEGPKAARTNSSEVIVRSQALVPAQAALQPESRDPEAGEAVRLTTVPEAKVARHDVPQLMPVGVLATVPLPLPASATNTMWDVAVALPSMTVTLPLPFVT